MSGQVYALTASVDSQVVEENASLAFSCSASVSPPGSVASYDWNWGDGTAHGTTASPSHTYTTAGAYTVTLTVTSSTGRTRATTIAMTVIVAAEFSITSVTLTPAATPVYVGTPVAFSAVGAGFPSATTFEWDYNGDGVYEASSSVTPDHTNWYPAAGTFTARFRVSGPGGSATMDATPITVANRISSGAGGRTVSRLEYVGQNSAVALSTFNYPICSNADGSKVWIAYNKPSGAVVVAERPSGTSFKDVGDETGWTEAQVSAGYYIDTAAYHDGPSVARDSAGYIHVFYLMHNSHWGYSVSNSPDTIAGGFTAKVGVAWNIPGPPSGNDFVSYAGGVLPGLYVTYARVYTDPNGLLMLSFRDRDTDWERLNDPRTPEGIGCFAIYDTVTQTWKARQLFRDGAQVGAESSPYGWIVGMHGYAFSDEGGPNYRIHMATAWRQDPTGGSESGTDVTYAYSDDLGTTWYRSDGTEYATIPIARMSGSPDIIIPASDMPAYVTPAPISGTVASAAAATVTLDAAAAATASLYNGWTIEITGGLGAGQTRLVPWYTSGRLCYLDKAWTVQPDATSTYTITAHYLVKQADFKLMAHGTDIYLFVGRDSGAGKTYMKHSLAGVWDALVEIASPTYLQETAINSAGTLMRPDNGSIQTSTNKGVAWSYVYRTTGLGLNGMPAASTRYLDRDLFRYTNKRQYMFVSTVHAHDGVNSSDVFFVIEEA
mgnify:FL=1